MTTDNHAVCVNFILVKYTSYKFAWLQITTVIHSIVLCPEVTNQPYRNRDQYDRTIGGKTIFSCIQDFIMIGVPELTCKRNGRWNHEEPICYSKSKILVANITMYYWIILIEKCPNARQTPNGRVVQSGVKFGDTANYTCNFGYRLAAGHIANVVCEQNGQWSYGPPRCVQS